MFKKFSTLYWHHRLFQTKTEHSSSCWDNDHLWFASLHSNKEGKHGHFCYLNVEKGVTNCIKKIEWKNLKIIKRRETGWHCVRWYHCCFVVKWQRGGERGRGGGVPVCRSGLYWKTNDVTPSHTGRERRRERERETITSATTIDVRSRDMT